MQNSVSGIESVNFLKYTTVHYNVVSSNLIKLSAYLVGSGFRRQIQLLSLLTRTSGNTHQYFFIGYRTKILFLCAHKWAHTTGRFAL